jgi:hypothetical protein
MDNAVAIPGYKVYVAADGSRPDVCVAFLDVAEDPGGCVTGVCMPVDAPALAALDRRAEASSEFETFLAGESCTQSPPDARCAGARAYVREHQAETEAAR